MNAITRLCNRTILLEQGRMLKDGPSQQVVGSYLNSTTGATAQREWTDLANAPGNQYVRLLAVRVRSEDGIIKQAIDIRQSVKIEMEYQVLTNTHVLVPNIHLFNEEGVCICVINDLDPVWHRQPRLVGRYISTMSIPGNFLAEGTITARIAISTYIPLSVHLDLPDVVAFQVVDSLEGNSARGDYAGTMPGVVRPIFNWTTQILESTPSIVIP